jgi:(2S)-methylsuccinyl-CoA dehydrogenase
MAERESAAHDLLSQAEGALDSARRLMNKALQALHDRTVRDGRVSADAMDCFQSVCYDIALSASEQKAGRAVLDYARQVRDAHSRDRSGLCLEERLASLFVAEGLQNFRNRVAFRTQDFGLTWEDLASTLDQDDVQSFCSGQLAGANMTEIADAVRQAGGSTGRSLLEKEYEEVRKTFRSFSDRIVSPLAERIHTEKRLVPDEILQPLKEMGVFGLSIPKRFGGQQDDDREDNLSMILATEELSRGSLGAAGSLITRPEILARAIQAGGTKEQQERWLRRLAAGETLGAVAVTEPDYGSDVASMKVKAERTDGGWLLKGTKTWSTFSGKANLLLVLARTDPDPAKGHKGLSLFLAEKPSFDGLEFEHIQPGGGKIRGKAIPAIGYRGMHSFWLVFQDYFVPDECLLGGEDGLGKGFYYLMAGFSGGRIQTAARAVGVMQAAFEQALSYSSRRTTFGKPIGDYQLTKVKLARMAVLLTAGRQFTYTVGRMMDQGEGQLEANMVKLFTCKGAEWLTREAMQIHGAKGYAEGSPVSRYFVDARVLSIFEGAEEILAIKVIARSLIEQGVFN